MQLIPEWKLVLRKAWSVKFLALAGVLTGCELVLPLYMDALPRHLFVGLVILVSVAGIISRVVSQTAFQCKKDEHEPD